MRILRVFRSVTDILLRTRTLYYHGCKIKTLKYFQQHEITFKYFRLIVKMASISRKYSNFSLYETSHWTKDRVSIF